MDALGDLSAHIGSATSLGKRLAEVLGPHLVVITNRHNHYGVSSNTSYRAARMHRDSLQWLRTYVTILIPLQGFDEPAAQLRILPGSHLWSVDGAPNGGGFWIDETPYAALESQALQTTLELGDVLLIDPLIFHAAGCGSESATRKMLSLAIHSGDELAVGTATNEKLVTDSPRPYRGQSWLLNERNGE